MMMHRKANQLPLWELHPGGGVLLPAPAAGPAAQDQAQAQHGPGPGAAAQHGPGFSRPSHHRQEPGGGKCDDAADTAENDAGASAEHDEVHVNDVRIPRHKFRKQQMKLRKQKLSIVFNYSSIILTEPMERVLNRGLNFCVQPLKLDLTQVLVDFRYFERSMIWMEFFYDREQGPSEYKPIFKSKKHN
jgi:hypothetical protein